MRAEVKQLKRLLAEAGAKQEKAEKAVVRARDDMAAYMRRYRAKRKAGDR